MDWTGEMLIAHCRDLVGGYKVPRAIYISADPFPKSGRKDRHCNSAGSLPAEETI